MPDDDPENAAPAQAGGEPLNLGDDAGDPLLQELHDRMPDGYDFDGELIRRVRTSGRARPICGAALVRTQARTASGSGWCAEILFRSKDGQWHGTVVPIRDLLSAPARVVSTLVDRGYELRGRPRDVCDFLLAMPVDRIGEAVEVTGWVGDRFDAFVCPSGEVITGTGVAREILFSGQPRVTAASVASAGRAEAAASWWAGVRARGAAEAVMLGLAASFAPVVLPVRGDPSFLLHLHGNEAAGRISRTVAAGVWGPPAQVSLSWADAPDRILAAIAAAGDGLVVLAGYEQRYHRKISAVAEAMAAMDASGPRRVVILSTGQAPIQPQEARTPGQQDLRAVIDIDARAWDAEAADAIAAAAATGAGVFGPLAVRSAIDWRLGEKGVFLTIRVEDVLKTLTGADVGPIDTETDRISRVFGALHGAAAVLELQRLVPGLDRSTALFRRLFADWVARNRGVMSAADRQLLGRAATAIREILQNDVLTPLETVDPVVPFSEVGWQDAEAVYLSVATMTRVAAAGGSSIDRLIDLLLSRKLLQHQAERGNQWRLPSKVVGRPRAYKIPRAAILRYAAALPDPE
jgi:hypothetical protein